jgi:hypothetical protein
VYTKEVTMVLVRHVFQIKWGKVHEVVAALKESQGVMEERHGVRSRILTDLSGPFHTVVQEIEVPSLGEWEKGRAEAFADPELQKRMARTEGLIESGRAEFYTIEA